MNNPKKSAAIRGEGAEAPIKRSQPKKSERAGTPDQPIGEWTYPSSAIFVEPSAIQPSRTPARKRKRRTYADYRELVALESQARKLNFLGPDGARSLPAEPQTPQTHERALPFPENEGNNAATDSISAQRTLPLDLPVFSPVAQPAILAVDQRMNMFFGSRRNLKSVVAANAAALVAWRMLAQGRRVGALVFNDKKIVQTRPACSRLHTLLFLQTVLNQNHSLLADAGICSNHGMLNDALRRINRVSDSPLAFLITDGSGRDQETFRLATDISQHSDLLVILVYDPRQAKLFNTRRHSLAGQFFPDGVPVIPLNTQNDVAYQLRHSLIRSALSSFTKIRRLRAASVPLDAQRP
jgi:hypothetical protein